MQVGVGMLRVQLVEHLERVPVPAEGPLAVRDQRDQLVAPGHASDGPELPQRDGELTGGVRGLSGGLTHDGQPPGATAFSEVKCFSSECPSVVIISPPFITE